MESHKKNTTFNTLVFVNAVLFFAVAFYVGGRMAGAEIQLFDLPAAQTSYTLDENSPYTAQFPEYKEQLSATVTPENPAPEERAEISLEIYSFDINSADITWKQNGKVVSSGIGKKKFLFTNGASGVTTTIEATIDPKDRPIITKTFTFTPSEVDLLWQANTYTHPFYKGKSLFTPEASALFVAFPRTKNGSIKPQETVFNWTENYNRQADRSGYGRNTYSFQGSIIAKKALIKVDTHAPKTKIGGNANTASKEATITPQRPGLFFYEENPALGILFNKALFDTITLNKPEIKLAVYPFFQTTSGKNTDLNYTWQVDNNIVNISSKQNSIVLKKTNREKGDSVVLVQSENPLRILQTVTQGLSIRFDNEVKTVNTTPFGN